MLHFEITLGVKYEYEPTSEQTNNSADFKKLCNRISDSGSPIDFFHFGTRGYFTGVFDLFQHTITAR
jgi:hypothetical protein